MNAYTRPIKDMHSRIAGKDTDTLKVFVCSTCISAGSAIYTVLVDGEYYKVCRSELEMLRRGDSPEDLALEPSTADTEDE